MSPNLKKVAVLIVTYNSQKVLPKALEALRKQTHPPHQILLVDTGSVDREYLKGHSEVVFAQKEGGFCLGNNVGYPLVDPSCAYLLLLNPDAFLFPDFIEKAVERMEQDGSIGAVTGTTYGYDLAQDTPSGFYDTTGIFQTWYGKWNDRGQGEKENRQKYRSECSVDAICGAVYFARKKALDSVLVQGQLFKPHFYMYKEDIDLSLRLSRAGWKLLFVPHLHAYHCRGWQGKRSAIPRHFRLLSAKNELHIQLLRKNPLPIFYSGVKWVVVKVFNF